MRACVFLLVLAFFLSSCANKKESHSVAKEEISIPEHSQEHLAGKEIYSTHCKSCHGADGSLGMSGAKNLKVSTLSKDEIIHQVTNGKGMMTAFKGKLSASEIVAVSDYVMELGKPE